MFSLKDFPARTLDRKKKLNSSNIWRAGWGISVVTCRAVVRLVWTQRRWRIRVKIFLNESSLWGPSMGRRHKEDAKRIKLQPREWVRWSVHSMRSTIHSLDYSLWKPWSPASGPHVRFQELYQGRGKWKEEHAAALSLLLWRRTTALCTFILKNRSSLHFYFEGELQRFTFLISKKDYGALRTEGQRSECVFVPHRVSSL